MQPDHFEPIHRELELPHVRDEDRLGHEGDQLPIYRK
jgi:hypothetical protein